MKTTTSGAMSKPTKSKDTADIIYELTRDEAYLKNFVILALYDAIKYVETSPEYEEEKSRGGKGFVDWTRAAKQFKESLGI